MTESRKETKRITRKPSLAVATTTLTTF